MRFVSCPAISAGDATQTSLTSAVIDASNLLAMSAMVVSTVAAVTGVVAIQVSNDDVINYTPTNWATVPTASASFALTGNYLIPKFDSCYRWARVVYTKTAASTGTLPLVSVNFEGMGF